MKKIDFNFHMFLKLTSLLAVIFSVLTDSSVVYAQEEIKKAPISKKYYICRENLFNDNSGKIIKNYDLILLTNDEKVELINWQGNYAKKACQFSAKRFQKFSDENKLRYQSIAYFDEYNVICSVQNKGEKCRQENILIYLSSEQDPEKILEKLFDISSRVSGGGVQLNAIDVYSNPSIFTGNSKINSPPWRLPSNNDRIMDMEQMNEQSIDHGIFGDPSTDPPPPIFPRGTGTR